MELCWARRARKVRQFRSPCHRRCPSNQRNLYQACSSPYESRRDPLCRRLVIYSPCTPKEDVQTICVTKGEIPGQQKYYTVAGHFPLVKFGPPRSKKQPTSQATVLSSSAALPPATNAIAAPVRVEAHTDANASRGPTPQPSRAAQAQFLQRMNPLLWFQCKAKLRRCPPVIPVARSRSTCVPGSLVPDVVCHLP